MASARYRCVTPVALLAFNRPNLTAKVLEVIARARPPQLLVVGDGPRPGHPEDAELVDQVRDLIDRVDWPCEVFTDYSEVNMGCRLRIASGLTWVFENVEEAIILEDDCLPDESFFRFCDELLDRYRDEHRIHQISGTNPLSPRRLTSDSYFFTRTHLIWGWASWRRAWAHYDAEMSGWPELRDSGWLEELLLDPAASELTRGYFDAAHAAWDFQWVYSSWRAGGLAITPVVNLVSNIGFGEGATHQRDSSHRFAGLPLSQLEFPLRHPNRVDALRAADRAIWRSRRGGSGTGPQERGRNARVRTRSKKEKLVMGAAVGLSLDQVRPFLRSLRLAGYDGDLVLFVDRRLRRMIRREPEAGEGVRLIAASQWLPFRLGLLRDPALLRRTWRPVANALWSLSRALQRVPMPARLRTIATLHVETALHTPMEARFLRYRHYLDRHPYERVLLTDVRDVVFQDDPFSLIPREGLSVSIETDAYTIAEEPHNAAWMRRVYGGTTLAEIGDQPVSCVGVITGDWSSIQDYLDDFCGELMRLAPAATDIGGADTAIHNMLLWTGRLGAVHMLEPLRSPVATLNGLPDGRLRLDGDGRLLNEDGKIVSILHQYDRIPRLAAAVRRRLSAAASHALDGHART